MLKNNGLKKRTHLPKQMPTLQSRPYVVKIIQPAKRRTLAKKFHPSAGTGADAAAAEAACQVAAVVIILPVSIDPDAMCKISPNFTTRQWFGQREPHLPVVP
jgi:hypothetical protein